MSHSATLEELVKKVITILQESIEDISAIGKESVLHDLLAFKLRDALPGIEKRRRIVTSSYPHIEVDLADLKQGIALEVKLNPSRFYEGIQQAIVLRDVYGLEPVLIQVYDKVDERVIRALRIIAVKYSIPIIIVEKRNKGVIWLGAPLKDSS